MLAIQAGNLGDVGERLTYQLMYVSDEICHEKHA